MLNNTAQLLSIVSILLTVGGIIGGIFAFRHSKKITIIEIQKDTIEALQSQIDTLKDRQEEIEAKNIHLEHIISTIQDALKQRGIIVTVDGDLVTIQDAGGAHSIKRTATAPLARGNSRPRRPQQKKKEGDV